MQRYTCCEIYELFVILREVALPKSLTTVTPFSKYLALVLFILFPIVGFYLGVLYGRISSFPVLSIHLHSPLYPPTAPSPDSLTMYVHPEYHPPFKQIASLS